MKLAAVLLLFALVGKMSASPSPYRLAYFRAAVPQQQSLVAEDDASDETEISQEDFSNDNIQDEIQDDDDDSDEQEAPPQFSKLFPLPQRNSPGHNFPLSIMMGEVSQQGWNVPKAPQRQRQSQRQRARFELARDDDDEDDEESDEDEEEDDEPEDDLPNWQKLFPNLNEQELNAPPQGVSEHSAQPQAFRSAIGGSRVVYVPASQLRRSRPVQGGQRIVMRAPITTPRHQVMYQNTPYMKRQQYVNNRPQYVLAPVSNSVYRRPQIASSPIYVRPQIASNIQRRQQGSVYYMPVRRNTNSYSPYVNRPYVSRPYAPRYRFY